MRESLFSLLILILLLLTGCGGLRIYEFDGRNYLNNLGIQINHDEEAVKRLAKYTSQSEIEIRLREIEERLNDFFKAKGKRDVTEKIPAPGYLGLVRAIPYYHFENQAKKHLEALLSNNSYYYLDLIYDSGQKIRDCKVRFEYFVNERDEKKLKLLREQLFESDKVGGLKTTDLIVYDGENTNSTVKFNILGMRKTKAGNGLIVYGIATLESNGKVIKVFRWVGPVICGTNLFKPFHMEIKASMVEQEKKVEGCQVKLSRKTDNLCKVKIKDKNDVNEQEENSTGNTL